MALFWKGDVFKLDARRLYSSNASWTQYIYCLGSFGSRYYDELYIECVDVLHCSTWIFHLFQSYQKHIRPNINASSAPTDFLEPSGGTVNGSEMQQPNKSDRRPPQPCNRQTFNPTRPLRWKNERSQLRWMKRSMILEGAPKSISQRCHISFYATRCPSRRLYSI